MDESSVMLLERPSLIVPLVCADSDDFLPRGRKRKADEEEEISE